MLRLQFCRVVLPVMDLPDKTNEKRFGNNIISGFYEEHTHKVLSVDSCLIQDPLAESIMKSLRRLMKKYHIRSFKEDTGHGTLRHVLFRKG